MKILHGEGGSLVDRTISRDFSTKKICASVSSLSPFVLAEQIDTNLPSISGLILDDSGNPLSGVSVGLTGTEERQTETNSDGSFKFVNLTPNGNYNVSPKSVGYIFEEYNTNFIDLTGEETVFFEGTAADFQITGTVRDGLGNPLAGVSMELDGSEQGVVDTDANGEYTFAGLPADGSYFVTPRLSGLAFQPEVLSVSALTSNVSGADFQGFAPTAAAVTIAGRVMTADGNGIGLTAVTLNGSNGVIGRVITNPFGYYQFDAEAGGSYIVSVSHRAFTFAEPSRVINPLDNINDLNFVSSTP
ncbi:MAG: carboxypeptidase regulatory-like domain-containing protein [Acidobacteria bacterium]|nr:carboxypeptidase regulatory-like domain-containing protein [Acidobacteriota bacterium]